MLDLFIPLNDDETISNVINDIAFLSVNEPTTTLPIILPTLPPITDTGLGNININDTDNSAHSIHKIQHNINDAKCTKNCTNLSTNGTVIKTKEKFVSISTNESNKLKKHIRYIQIISITQIHQIMYTYPDKFKK